MDRIVAVVHVNGFDLINYEFVPREIAIASIVEPLLYLRTFIIDDNEFYRYDDLFQRQTNPKAKLLNPRYKNYRYSSDEKMKTTSMKVINLIHFKRCVKSCLRHCEDLYFNHMKKNSLRFIPTVAVRGERQKDFFKSFLPTYTVIDLNDIISREKMKYLKLHIERCFDPPIYHKDIHVENDILHCSTRIVWLFSRMLFLSLPP